MRPLSARNPRITRLAKLARRREERAEQRAFVVEGPLLAGVALDAGAPILDAYLDEAALDRPEIAAVAARLEEVVEPWVVPAGTLDRVGDAVTSQGLVAVCGRAEPVWPHPSATDLVLVLVDVADPGNAGTLVRSAVAAGAGTVVVAGGVDPTSPKVVRSSAGALFGVDVVVTDLGPVEVVDRLDASGYAVVATVVDGASPYDAVDLTGPVAVVVGNEAHGLPAAVAEVAQRAVSIPMAGPTESLNAAMAGTIVCFEVLRQRRAARPDRP
ncbi:MAG: RNA methyltransferase [Actinobacteria bacterium]|nr:RNA methyltransferase [Actinomycetota bacterium]